MSAADEYGLSPLHYAAESGHAGAVETLLRLGANADQMDEMGKTAGEVAKAWGFPEVEALLGPTAHVHEDDPEPSKPLPEGAIPLFPQAPPTGDMLGGRRKQRTMRMPDQLQPEMPEELLKEEL